MAQFLFVCYSARISLLDPSIDTERRGCALSIFYYNEHTHTCISSLVISCHIIHFIIPYVSFPTKDGKDSPSRPE